MPQDQVIKLTPKFKQAAAAAIKAAITYEKVSGRKLGITGEVGEIIVCSRLKLNLLSNPISAGYDAVDTRGNKYQIKARRGGSSNPGAKIGSFSKHKFDYAVLVILDDNYKLVAMYKVSYKKILPVIESSKRRAPTLRKFIKLSQKI